MRFLIFPLVSLAAALAGIVRADNLLLPKGFERTEGNVSAGPFRTGAPSRVLQVYGASEFGAFGPLGAMITELRFRVDSHTGPSGHAIIPELEVRMSTTAKSPDQLSRIVAENIGPDETIVVPKRELQFDYVVDRTGPNSLSIVIPFQKPFYYDPLKGNLFLDLQVLKTPLGTSPVLDAVNASDAYSLLVTSPGAVEGQQFSWGMVTQFTFTPVPEPSVGLWFLGFGVLLVYLKGAKNCAAWFASARSR